MAITQISRIQHRRGLKEALPQLAAGELGWAVDTQELYIGNGTTSEGAPEVGNTKIITEDDNILSVANTYTYRGNTDSPIVTGVDANSPKVRTLQQKLDDFANVKDFGAVGDGVTNDTAAINRAIKNLQTVESTGKQKRALYFPGGIYLITGDVIKIYPNSNLIGDGMQSTIFRQTDSGQACVIRTCDSLGEIGANIGSSGSTKPNAIHISGIAFEIQSAQDIAIIDQTEDLHFTNCHFTGVYDNQDGQSSNKACVVMNSTSGLPTKRVTFLDCTFEKTEYAVNVSDDVEDVMWSNCEFITHYRAFNLAETSDGSTVNKTQGPTGFVINACRFDLIDAEAIKIYNNGGSPKGNIVSSCSFRRVGDNADDSAERSAIQFEYGGNYSISNYFHRTDNISNFAGTVYNEGPAEHPITLSASQTNAVTGITVPTFAQDSTLILRNSVSVEIHYTILRTNSRRVGKLFITGHESSSLNITDDFSEDSSTGITFSINSSGQVLYTSTAGDSAVLKYRTIDFV